MAVQDRNMHRDARALRKTVGAVITTVAAGDVDCDIPILALQPRYNYRLMDLAYYAGVVATAAATLKASVVPNLSVVGTPIAAPAAATTFTIEEFWQNDNGVLTNVAAVAAQAFSDAFTVTDGFWGVVLVQIDGAQAITTKAKAALMAYATEEEALANCPKPDAGNGVVAIITIEASGADFVGGTDNTDTANAFNTASRDGHVAAVAISATPSYGNATLGQSLKDAAGVRILEGKGGVGGDLLVASVRSAGQAAFTNGQATVEFRPFPAQGEGRGDMSASQTEASFVP